MTPWRQCHGYIKFRINWPLPNFTKPSLRLLKDSIWTSSRFLDIFFKIHPHPRWLQDHVKDNFKTTKLYSFLKNFWYLGKAHWRLLYDYSKTKYIQFKTSLWLKTYSITILRIISRQFNSTQLGTTRLKSCYYYFLFLFWCIKWFLY